MKSFLAALALSASFAAQGAAPTDAIVVGRDYHSYADPTAFRVKHLDLDLQTSFEEKRLSGVADLTVTRVAERARAIYLQARPNYHPIATAALDKLLLRKAGS